MRPIHDFVQLLKAVTLPNKAVRSRILFGPFRGAQLMMNPQISLRYIFGLYEHELSGWVSHAIPLVENLVDVGANHGYFSFGVMAGWRRHHRQGVAWAFEPQKPECEMMRQAASWNEATHTRIMIENRAVSETDGPNTVSLNSFVLRENIDPAHHRTLIKIDVEGFEMEVLRGATELVRPESLFLVETHGDNLHEEVVRFFGARGHQIEVIEPLTLPLFGRERRTKMTRWVVSVLPKRSAK